MRYLLLEISGSPSFAVNLYGSVFVTPHPFSIKILVIHLVPALSSEDMV